MTAAVVMVIMAVVAVGLCALPIQQRPARTTSDLTFLNKSQSDVSNMDYSQCKRSFYRERFYFRKIY